MWLSIRGIMYVYLIEQFRIQRSKAKVFLNTKNYELCNVQEIYNTYITSFMANKTSREVVDFRYDLQTTELRPLTAAMNLSPNQTVLMRYSLIASSELSRIFSLIQLKVTKICCKEFTYMCVRFTIRYPKTNFLKTTFFYNYNLPRLRIKWKYSFHLLKTAYAYI